MISRMENFMSGMGVSFRLRFVFVEFLQTNVNQAGSKDVAYHMLFYKCNAPISSG